MLLRLAIAAVVFSASLVPARVRACSCAPQTQAEAFQAAASVFEGRVTRVAPAVVEEGSASVAVELAIVRGWKGVEQERVVVHSAATDAACGFAFVPDESYLVYAVEHAEGLWVTRCGRTRAVAAAGEDLRALGMGATPVDALGVPDAGTDRAREPPARGGCAGCTVGAGPQRGAPGAWILVLAGLALLGRIRARRPRSGRLGS